MKSILTFSFILFVLSSYGATKTSIADGDWYDANNWSPAGVPVSEDSVIVNHNITLVGQTVDFGANWLIINSGASLVSDTVFGLHGNLLVLGTVDIYWFAIGDGDSTIVNGTVYGSRYIPGNPTNINYGSILADTLIEGDTFDNYGLFDGKALISSTDFRNYSGAAVITSGNCVFGALATNDLNATMVVGDLITSDITNDGDISCQNWTHSSGTADGSGKYCLALCFLNNAAIGGTLDVCDATPNGFCDIQMGTIAGTVTFCAVSPCSNNLGTEETVLELKIYPNPASFNIKLIVDESLMGMDFVLTNISGQIVRSGVFTNLETELNISDLSTGMYVFSVDGSTIRQKLIIE